MRFHLLRSLYALTFALGLSTAHAAWPEKTIRILVPFPPGSASDLIARTLADKLQAKFPAGLVVENRPGAGGTIATAEMVKSPKDGYTIMTGTMGTHAIAPSLYKSLPFDPLKDLIPISIVAEVPLMVVAWFGLVLGDALVFHWGHRFGPWILRRRFVARIVAPHRLAGFQARVSRGGPAYIFLIRFMPGIRTALFFAAGTLKLPYRTLFLYDGIAALIELPLLVYGVRFVGGRWQEILAYIKQFQVVLLIALAVVAIAFVLWRRMRRNAATPSRAP